MTLSQDERDLEAWAAEWIGVPELADMLKISVGRIAMRRLRQLRHKMSGSPDISVRGAMPDDSIVRHILDWMIADYLAGAAWVDNLDALGRQKKLMKCGSFEALLHEADKAMRKRLQGKSGKIGEGDEVTVATLPGGYSVVRLMTPLALDVESQRMRHCVGQGAYDETVERGTTEIYSLRDRDGKSLVTMEVSLDNLEWSEADDDFRTRPLEGSGRTVDQIQGPGNKRPPVEHMFVLHGFLEQSGWRGWWKWFRLEDPEMEAVLREWEALLQRDLAAFVDELLARADNDEGEDHDGIQPRR